MVPQRHLHTIGIGQPGHACPAGRLRQMCCRLLNMSALWAPALVRLLCVYRCICCIALGCFACCALRLIFDSRTQDVPGRLDSVPAEQIDLPSEQQGTGHGCCSVVCHPVALGVGSAHVDDRAALPKVFKCECMMRVHCFYMQHVVGGDWLECGLLPVSPPPVLQSQLVCAVVLHCHVGGWGPDTAPSGASGLA